MRPKGEFYWRDLEPYWTRDGDDPGRITNSNRATLRYVCQMCEKRFRHAGDSLLHQQHTGHETKLTYLPDSRR